MRHVTARSPRELPLVSWLLASATVAAVLAAAAGSITQRGLVVDAPVPEPDDWFVVIQSTSAIVWLTFGFVTASRPELLWSRLAMLAACSHGAAAVSYVWAVRGLAQLEPAPGAPLAAWLTGVLLPVEMAVLGYLLASLPSGRLVHDPYRHARRLAVALPLSGIVVGFLGEPDLGGTDFEHATNPLPLTIPVTPLAPVLLLTGALVAVGVLVGTWRTSQGWQRTAMRWVVAIHVIGTIIVAPAVAAGSEGLGVGVAQIVNVLGLVAMVGIIHRHQLLGIQRLLERTLAVTLLVAALAAVYAIVVLIGSRLLGASGEAIGTIAVALAVLPIRDRLGRLVERFIYGDRSEPTAIVERISRAAQEAASPIDLLERSIECLRSSTGAKAIEIERTDGTRQLLATGQAHTDHVTQVSLQHLGVQLGILSVWHDDDPLSTASVHAVAPHLAVLLESCERDAELRAARADLVRTREEERRRLRHDLHDGLGPILTGAAFSTDAATNLVVTDPDEAIDLLRAARLDITTGLNEIRRIVDDLRPPALDEIGLPAAVEQHARRFPQLRIAVRCHGTPTPNAAASDVAAYRIITEALTNAARHARATSVDIQLDFADHLSITITDNGTTTDAWSAGVGLTSMRRRAEELGGTFAAGPRPGAGGRVRATLPLEPR